MVESVHICCAERTSTHGLADTMAVQALLRLSSRGEALVAELLRLSAHVPHLFSLAEKTEQKQALPAAMAVAQLCPCIACHGCCCQLTAQPPPAAHVAASPSTLLLRVSRAVALQRLPLANPACSSPSLAPWTSLFFHEAPARWSQFGDVLLDFRYLKTPEL